MNVRDLLPIGSVVLLKEGEKRLMVSGVKQTDLETDIEYDYLGYLYPEGHVGEEFQFLFNHDDIDEVVFLGYQDEERDEFLEKLAVLYE